MSSILIPAVNTGDTTNFLLPALLGIGALVILILLIIFMKRSNRDDEKTNSRDEKGDN